MQEPLRSFTLSSATRRALLLALPLASISSCGGSGDYSNDDPQWREVVVPLPSGVTCSVEVTTPVDGAVLPAAPVGVTGFATVGEAVAVPNTTIVYVVDVSLSTASPGGCGGDPNGDGSGDTILDCEITALSELHGQAATLGTIFDAGVAVFGESGAAGDVVPGGTPNDLLTGPTTDLGPLGPNGTADVVDVLRSADSGLLSLFTARSVGGNSTSFGSGIDAAATILGASTQTNQLVVFVSDGANNTGPAVATAIGGLPAGATVFTFAVGSGSDCDAGSAALGTLRDISNATGGSCTNVPDPEDLPSILPSIIMSQLVGLTLTLDASPVVIDTITPSLPQDGPATATYSTTLPAPGLGLHTVCARSTCTDASGEVQPEECSTFRINAPPVAKCEDVSVAADAMCQAEASIDEGSFDPDGDAFSCVAEPEGPYALGVTSVTLTCTDAHGASSECTGEVEVFDDTPPSVTSVGLLDTLWPPNHSYHGFSVDQCIAEVTDNCEELDPFGASTVRNISSDEAELAHGSGNTCDDAVILGATSFQLRSERVGSEDGRVYDIGFVVSDSNGNETEATCQVTVAHDQGGGAIAVDSGCALCVGSGCGACSAGDPACL